MELQRAEGCVEYGRIETDNGNGKISAFSAQQNLWEQWVFLWISGMLCTAKSTPLQEHVVLIMTASSRCEARADPKTGHITTSHGRALLSCAARFRDDCCPPGSTMSNKWRQLRRARGPVGHLVFPNASHWQLPTWTQHSPMQRVCIYHWKQCQMTRGTYWLQYPPARYTGNYRYLPFNSKK